MIAHYKMWQQKSLMKNVPYSIYVTKDYLQSKYPTNGKSISCSDVMLQSIDERSLEQRIESIQGSKNEKLVLGTVAAIDVPYKGQGDVIKAIRTLKNDGIYISYKIVGRGDPTRLQNIIVRNNLEGKVKIVGSLKHEKVFDFMKDIDLYIQPSKQEGLPRALIEAMNTGCPALGARTAGIPELLEDECVFTPGKVSEIVKKIKMIDKPWLINQAKKNFSVSKDYQKKNLNKRRMDFYEEFIENELKK